MAQKIRIKRPDQTILIVLTFLWAIHKFNGCDESLFNRFDYGVFDKV